MARRTQPAFEPVAWIVYTDEVRGKRFTDHLEAQRFARGRMWMGRPAEIDALYRFRVNYYDGIDRDNHSSKVVVAMNEEAVREAFYVSNDGDSWEISSVEKLRPDTGPRGPDPKISHGTGGLASSYEEVKAAAERFDREIRQWISAGGSERIETEDGGFTWLPVRGVTSTGPDEPERFSAKVWIHDGARSAEAVAPTRAQAFREAVAELDEGASGRGGLGALVQGLGFWNGRR